MVRDCIGVDWAIGLQVAIEQAVRAAFPTHLRLWPLMQPCRFDSFWIGLTHLVVVLHDQVGKPGIAGPIRSGPFPHSDHPALPRGAQDAGPWQEYLNRTFRLRTEDAAIILPLRDSGVSSPAADFARFSEDEKKLVYEQVLLIVERQAVVFATRRQLSTDPKAPPVIELRDDGAVWVRRGGVSKLLHGTERVWLFMEVVEAGARGAAWADLLRSKLKHAGEQAVEAEEGEAGREVESAAAKDQAQGRLRVATSIGTLKRTGSRIRDALGILGHFWQQDGHGAKWNPLRDD